MNWREFPIQMVKYLIPTTGFSRMVLRTVCHSRDLVVRSVVHILYTFTQNYSNSFRFDEKKGRSVN